MPSNLASNVPSGPDRIPHLLQNRRTFAGFQLGSARDKVAEVRDLSAGASARRCRLALGWHTKHGSASAVLRAVLFCPPEAQAATRPEQPLRDRQLVSGVGKLVHERGFHFVDRRGGELVRRGDFAPMARGLRDLSERATGLIRS